MKAIPAFLTQDDIAAYLAPERSRRAPTRARDGPSASEQIHELRLRRELEEVYPERSAWRCRSWGPRVSPASLGIGTGASLRAERVASIAHRLPGREGVEPPGPERPRGRVFE
jgi:hypothetical protein